MKSFRDHYKPELGSDVVIAVSDDILFLPFHEFDCEDFFNWCVQHSTPSNAPVGVSTMRRRTLLIKPRYFEYFSILNGKCIRVSGDSLCPPCVWIVHKSDWDAIRGCKYTGWFDISKYAYAAPGKYEKNVVNKLPEDNSIWFEFENGQYVARHVNPIDAASLYPEVDSYLYVGGRNNGKTELIKQLMESANLRCEPFPDYKYDSAAYQSIVASREAMKRAEHGDAVDALSYCAPKGSFWDLATEEEERRAREYMLNDIKVTRELFEDFVKEENENMEKYIRTTDSTKTLTGYVSDVTVTQTGADETYDIVEITLQVPRHVVLSKNNYPFSLTVADIHKMVDNRKLTTLAFEDPKDFMEPYIGGSVKPKKVIFNNPATIVLWNDGTKTVVTRQKGDRYNKEEGLALCYMKKALGNSSRVFNDALHAGLEMGEK